MAQRKPFIDRSNPALQFISTIAEDTTDAEPRAEVAPEAPSTTAQAPTGYKLNPLYVEKKSRRLQLLLQPSLYDKVKAAAERDGKSVNDYIHSLLEEATKEN